MSFKKNGSNAKKKKNAWFCIACVCIFSMALTVRAFAEEIEAPPIQQGSDENIILSEEELTEINRNISSSITAERLLVVLKAYSLEGEVSYYWGGKSSAIGWDKRWGKQSYVTSEGSRTTGTLRTFGLDCSGYVNWVFNNAMKKDVTLKVGNGTTSQWAKSSAVSWNNAQPGDLAFFYDPINFSGINHVGIVVGENDKNELLVAHCSSSYNNVVITEAESTGFKYIRTPDIYEDAGVTDKIYRATSSYKK